ncbi:hypothetical protein KM043_002803 [Ampulex compressa]|nr:hypothetical protein KM043_002803 [Ampulex compressa]
MGSGVRPLEWPLRSSSRASFVSLQGADRTDRSFPWLLVILSLSFPIDHDAPRRGAGRDLACPPIAPRNHLPLRLILPESLRGTIAACRALMLKRQTGISEVMREIHRAIVQS